VKTETGETTHNVKLSFLRLCWIKWSKFIIFFWGALVTI